MKITVTQEHIDKGVPGSGTSCPIALACKEAMKRDDIEVGQGHVKVGDGWFYLPLRAVAFMTCFDNRHPNVYPFEFEDGPEIPWWSPYSERDGDNDAAK